MPEWAFGLWQSRQRYETDQQSLDVSLRISPAPIPFDNIVQDGILARQLLGSMFLHRFYPVGWLKTLHALHTHVMTPFGANFLHRHGNFDVDAESRLFYQPISRRESRTGIDFLNTFSTHSNPRRPNSSGPDEHRAVQQGH